MKLKLFGLVTLVVAAVPRLVMADNFMTPWGAMNDFGPWDSSDIVRQEYKKAQPHYPTRPARTARQRQEFSRPINHASVDIDARLPDAHVFVKKLNGTVRYDVEMKVNTPEYPAMLVVGYPAKTKHTLSNRQLELDCEIESIRRWDRERTRGWAVRVAATFSDDDTVKLLDKAKTVLMTHGVCYPVTEKRGQLATQGVYEYHAGFISQFEDSDKTAVMMEIGTGLHFNTAGNGYFERPRIEMAYTTVNDRDQVRIKYK
jgi:hypothetical protein